MSEFEMEIEEGIVDAPERIAIIGDGGIGKTSMAASAPRPFILDIETGSKRFKHVGRNKTPITDWETLFKAIHWIRTSKHPYKTLVLDTLDRAEWYCWRFLCQRDGVETIEQVAHGYGKGYNAAYEQFRLLFSVLEQVRDERSMHIIILAHPKIEKVRNPNGADYDRFAFKVHASVGNMLYEACDHVLFAARNTIVTDTVYDEARPRAIGGDKRLLHTMGSPTFMAKCRCAIPSPIPLSWHEWVCQLAAAGFPRLLKETVQDNARRLGDSETQKKIESMIAETSDVKLLGKANQKLIQMLGGPLAAIAEDKEQQQPQLPQQQQQQQQQPSQQPQPQQSAAATEKPTN